MAMGELISTSNEIQSDCVIIQTDEDLFWSNTLKETIEMKSIWEKQFDQK